MVALDEVNIDKKKIKIITPQYLFVSYRLFTLEKYCVGSFLSVF
jgi:hypothetical protein